MQQIGILIFITGRLLDPPNEYGNPQRGESSSGADQAAKRIDQRRGQFGQRFGTARRNAWMARRDKS